MFSANSETPNYPSQLANLYLTLAKELEEKADAKFLSEGTSIIAICRS